MVNQLRCFLACLLGLSLALPAQSQTTIWEEDFTSGALPSGWAVDVEPPASGTDTSDGWRVGNYGQLTANPQDSFQYIPERAGDFVATNDWKCACSKNGDTLKTPAIALPDTSKGLMMSYLTAFRYVGYQNGDREDADILVSTDSGATWTQLIDQDGTNGWEERFLNLSAYIGDTVRLAFLYDDDGRQMLYWALDNIKVYEPQQYNLSLEPLSAERYTLQSTEDLQGMFVARGWDTLTSVDINYQIGNGPIQTYTYSQQVIPPDTVDFTHGTPMSLPNPQEYDIHVWINNPNGGADSDTTDNTGDLTISRVSQQVQRRPVLEEFTGAWCGYCPDGAYRIEQMRTQHPESITISIHQGDPMENNYTSTLTNRFDVTSYPNGVIGRRPHELGEDLTYSRGDWVQLAGEAKQEAAPAQVAFDTVMYDTTTRQFEAVVKADFYTELNGDYRLTLAVVEDSVRAPNNSAYDQVNYSNNTTGHPYQGAGDPITGFVHRHVMRAYVAGPFGNPINTNISNNSSVTDTFTYSIPPTLGNLEVAPEQIKLVAFVNQYDPSDNLKLGILNAADYQLENAIPKTNTARAQANALGERLQLFPNPARRQATLALELREAQPVNVQLLNMTGQVIAETGQQQRGPGHHEIPLQLNDEQGHALSAGLYFVRVQTQHGTTTRKLAVE